MKKTIQIVSCQEIKRIEALAFEKGCCAMQFMEKAAESFAFLTEQFILAHKCSKKIYIFAGKGNNGGDAYKTASFLFQKKFDIEVFSPFSKEELSSMCKLQMESFKKEGGKVVFIERGTLPLFEKNAVILDGLLGTGFQSEVKDFLKETISHLNKSSLPILSLDIPSGLNGTTGTIHPIAISATETFYLEFPKIGFFLKDGWNHVGNLKKAIFGLPAIYAQQLLPSAFLIDEKSTALPKIQRNRSKYETGYVLAIAGSKSMEGAAMLSSLATLRSGSGIVRLFSSSSLTQTKLSAEIICEKYNLAKILQESQRAHSVFIGPGLGRNRCAKKIVKAILSNLKKPTVIDADALYFLSSIKLEEGSILTPHLGEMKSLLNGKEVTLDRCQEFVQKRNVILVLKGAPTFLFYKDNKPLVFTRGDPGMATAGSGDVLTGVIASLLSQKLPPLEAACLGIFLHALAGEKAAEEKTSYSLIASDIIEHLPYAFKALKG